ncbi:MAG: SDR family oxidoreductase [Flavipsychrobacter sp.]
MKNVLLAGATGYLGTHILTELLSRNYHVRALARHPEKLRKLHTNISEIIEAEVTRPETLVNCCQGIDTVITAIGITRQKDGLTYMDVDYQANLNLLNEAKRSGVKRFIYVFIFNAVEISNLKIIQAKQKFADQLKSSGIDYCLINPTGFFSDMADFLKMAKKGRAYVFGNGNFKINPIDGSDLAKVCVNAIDSTEKEINVGGPEVLTYNQIAETAFRVLNKPSKITHIPLFFKRTLLFLLRKLTSVSTYGPVEFFMTVLTRDMVAPQNGTVTLQHYFQSLEQSGR